MKLVFFSSLFISIGNLIFTLYCPNLIKRFDSANDMYLTHLTIHEKRKNAQVDDDFTGDYDHCLKGFKKFDYKSPWLRLTCFIFFVLGFALLAWLIIDRSIVVIKT